MNNLSRATILAVAACLIAGGVTAPASASITITLDPGPVGTSLGDFVVLPFNDLAGQTFDGSTLMVDFVFPAGIAIQTASTPAFPSASAQVFVRLYNAEGQDPAAGPPTDAGNLLRINGAAGSPDFEATGADVDKNTSGDNQIWEYITSQTSDIQPGYAINGVTMNVLLPNDGLIIDHGELLFLVNANFPGNALPAELFVVPEPGSLALLGLGGLITARRRA